MINKCRVILLSVIFLLSELVQVHCKNDNTLEFFPVNLECVQEYSACSKNLLNKAYYSSHAGSFHNPICITEEGDVITLEDGSRWQVCNIDRNITSEWFSCDNIIILPNHSWLSSYAYMLLNQNTHYSVRVNLISSPVYNGKKTHWIVTVDYYNQEVCLEDGSFWKVSASDYLIMEDWKVHDTIIIGINDSWFSSKPNILINARTGKYIIAVCEN